MWQPRSGIPFSRSSQERLNVARREAVSGAVAKLRLGKGRLGQIRKVLAF